MPISDEQRHTLRGAAHKLKPVVLLGKGGLTDAVLAEINSALDHHELIKVKIRSDDRDERRLTIDEIVQKTSAELIQTIGQIAVLYRPQPKEVRKAPVKKVVRKPARAAPSPRRPAPIRKRS
jgi:RNA-binding protein